MDVLIYTMGRVGTMSVREALANAGLQAPNAHNLVVPGDIAGVKQPQTDFIKHIRRTQTPVVTLVRDPIARNLSAFYLHKDRFKSFYKFPHDESLSWFDNELLMTTNVDVYADTFHPDQGFRFYHGVFNKVLLIRTDKLSEVGAKTLSALTGTNVPAVPHLSSKIAEAYQEWLSQQLPLPRHYVDGMYAHHMVHHFFTESEIRDLKRKWLCR